ncbi:nodulin-like, Major facilitator superfamily domain protein [Artemisia annua]|uniref:Nodulin-like, Major facilitator superfamily domain protein n=1 Tax=Artemisia annua TaxID=35608 RepID=A0A2U1ME82_ARTAN|nr:nodulin-like, Major facilitator superfamily domain protein [Artemisia annua]
MNLNNLNDGDEAPEVDVLLAVGERVVTFENKRRPRRGEVFSFREAIVKANIWLLTTPLNLFSVDNFRGHTVSKYFIR